jgi:DNA-binding protein WhiA
MSFSKELREEIIALKMWDSKSNLTQDEQLARLILREAFIESGFINDPNKEYHLEMLFKKKEKAEKVKGILDRFKINNNITTKNNNLMIYIKEGEEISSFLALIGANRSVLAFEEIRVVKETRNNINRLVNCETANLNKTIDVGVKQIEDIKILKKNNVFDLLTEELKEIAELRLIGADISYEELGKMLKEPISKSGVSHRLKKKKKIAKELNNVK